LVIGHTLVKLEGFITVNEKTLQLEEVGIVQHHFCVEEECELYYLVAPIYEEDEDYLPRDQKVFKGHMEDYSCINAIEYPTRRIGEMSASVYVLEEDILIGRDIIYNTFRGWAQQHLKISNMIIGALDEHEGDISLVAPEV